MSTIDIRGHWKSLKKDKQGLVGHVSNQLEVGKEAAPLAKYNVVYPSSSPEKHGQLVESDAASITVWKGGEEDFDVKFLRPRSIIPLYWNRWIDDKKEPSITVNEEFSYRIDLSAIDFQSLVDKKGSHSVPIGPQDAVTSILFPKLEGKYHVTIFPIGDFLEGKEKTKMVWVDTERLTKTLTSKGPVTAGSYDDASEKHGALFVHGDDKTQSRVVFHFEPLKSGCATLAVVITNKERKKVVAAWLDRVNVLQKVGNDLSESDCKGLPETQLFDISTVPRFKSGTKKQLPSAQLTFLDLKDITVGVFEQSEQKEESDEAPKMWVIPGSSGSGLKYNLVRLQDWVDSYITKSNISELIQGEKEVHYNLKRMLFNCSDDPKKDDCPDAGGEAIKNIQDIAKKALDEKKHARMQVSFRDSDNHVYYMPVHFLRVDDKDILGNIARIDQPLPFEYGESKDKECKQEWAVGLVIQDKVLKEYFDQADWREKWMSSLKDRTCSNFFSTQDISILKNEYFLKKDREENTPRVGLVLMAHHGNGIFADTKDQKNPRFQISQDELQKTKEFAAGSFAILVSCSVGGVGGQQQDNSLMLRTLNAKGVSAAVLSPFEVPPEVTRPFFDALQETLVTLEEDTSLYTVFEKSKELYKKKVAEAGQPYLIPKVNLFMLVGDGDVRVCKMKK